MILNYCNKFATKAVNIASLAIYILKDEKNNSKLPLYNP